MNELKDRGVHDVLIAVVDVLKGLPAAIHAVLPLTRCRPASCIMVVTLWIIAPTGTREAVAAISRQSSRDETMPRPGAQARLAESGHGLHRLLTYNFAALMADGSIELAEVVQDGVRAGAGATSFRRKQNLYKYLKKVRRLVEYLKREIDEDPDASHRRLKAAQGRAAREREKRVAAALDKLAKIEAERERRGKTNKKQVAGQRSLAPRPPILWRAS